MKKRIAIMYFSPTGTTRTICTQVALGLDAADVKAIDMTRVESRNETLAQGDRVTESIDCMIVGSPVHSGKLPSLVMDYLKTLNGHGKEAIALVVYGNRDYGIALYKMVELLIERGFTVHTAAAFVGQHSYSSIVPVSLGRPNRQDIELAYQVGKKSLHATACLKLQDIPLQIDRISRSDRYTALKPTHSVQRCIQCKKCVNACPLGVLSPETSQYINKLSEKQCIGCMACVRNCAQNAKHLKVNIIVKTMMKRMFSEAVKTEKKPFILMT